MLLINTHFIILLDWPKLFVAGHFFSYILIVWFIPWNNKSLNLKSNLTLYHLSYTNLCLNYNILVFFLFCNLSAHCLFTSKKMMKSKLNIVIKYIVKYTFLIGANLLCMLTSKWVLRTLFAGWTFFWSVLELPKPSFAFAKVISLEQTTCKAMVCHSILTCK